MGGKLGQQLQKTLQKVQHKFAPPGHNGYAKLQDEDALPRDIPKGSCAVYVGDEMHRFVIQTQVLHHHLFQMLLAMSAEEFGYNPNGSLIMDCDVSFFNSLLQLVKTSNPCVLEHQIAGGVFGHTNWIDG